MGMVFWTLFPAARVGLSSDHVEHLGAGRLRLGRPRFESLTPEVLGLPEPAPWVRGAGQVCRLALGSGAVPRVTWVKERDWSPLDIRMLGSMN